METSAKRTLVKSPPELWEVASEPERLLGWTRELTGAPGAGYQVLESEPERLLRWRATGSNLASIGLELSASGFGTAVRVRAVLESEDPQTALNTLERLLDELGSPERRPFARA